MIIMDLKGTTNSSFQIEKIGPRINLNAGALEAKNQFNTSFVDLWGGILNAASDYIEINADASGTGADWSYQIGRPTSGMTSNLILTLPPNAGANNYVLTTDGSGGLSWAAQTSVTVMRVNSFNFTSASFWGNSYQMFILPPLGVIDKVEIIVDSPFSMGTASVTGAISGNTFMYNIAMTSIPTEEAYTEETNNIPIGSAEGIYFNAGGGPTGTGVGRCVVHYY